MQKGEAEHANGTWGESPVGQRFDLTRLKQRALWGFPVATGFAEVDDGSDSTERKKSKKVEGPKNSRCCYRGQL